MYGTNATTSVGVYFNPECPHSALNSVTRGLVNKFKHQGELKNMYAGELVVSGIRKWGD